MTRQEANIKILGILAEYVMANPDQRFGQILRNVGAIIDFPGPKDPQGARDTLWMNHFNEEPVSMLERMIKEEKKGKLS
jgi:hypothetical protein